MPNWAYVEYHIKGDKKDLRDLNKKLKNLEKRKTSRIPNGFGNLWLGNVVDILGGNWKEIQCRGSIFEYELNKLATDLVLRMEHAWAELTPFRRFLESQYPGMKIIYYFEEPGMGLYGTNDIDKEFFKHRYFVDDIGGPGGRYEHETLEDALLDLSRIIGKDLNQDMGRKELHELIGEFLNLPENEDRYVDFVEIEEYDD